MRRRKRRDQTLRTHTYSIYARTRDESFLESFCFVPWPKLQDLPFLFNKMELSSYQRIKEKSKYLEIN